MKLLQILSTILLSTSSASAFTVNNPISISSRTCKSSSIWQQPNFAMASTKAAEDNTLSEEDRLLLGEEWRAQLESDQVKEVRMELIQKYLSTGHDMELAEKEVDKFLSDPERSLQYLEMRDYAKSQNEMGFETALTLGAAFVIGLVGNVGMKYFAALSEASPDTDISQILN